MVTEIRFRTIDGPTVCFLKKDTEGDKTSGAEVCSSISQPELRRHFFCVEGGLVLAVIGRCALVARIVVGG